MTNLKILSAVIFSLFFVINSSNSEITSKGPYTGNFNPDDYLINKITLSQIGYIQFLKYVVDVPPLQEFTICTWLKSTNLTHSHSLLSYSRNEKERLIRMWLGAGGIDVNMAIMEVDIFAVPLNLFENHWNHICASWSAKRATWQLFMNGKLRETGIIPQLKDVIIPGEGDIVVGQEYTDFDKGLDDGIEGDIYGFNMILSSTLYPKVDSPHRRQIFVPNYHPSPTSLPLQQQQQPIQPHQLYQPFQQQQQQQQQPQLLHPSASYQVKESDDISPVLSYFKPSPNREPKGLVEIGRSALQDFYSILETNPRVRASPSVQYYPRHGYPVRTVGSTKRIYTGGVKNEVEGPGPKPLGLVLVELGYNRCALGRGAPVTDARVLVSWTKTPVRIFGGAILKSVQPFCKKH